MGQLGGGSPGQANNNGSMLEQNHKVLQAVDMDKARMGGFAVAQPSGDRGTPDNIKPEFQCGAMGTPTEKTGITLRNYVGLVGDDHAKGNIPGGSGVVEVREEGGEGSLVQGRQLETLAGSPD